ncbi:MAG: hypothetical protein Tsb0034_02070 [Ekhidna sp.]
MIKAAQIKKIIRITIAWTMVSLIQYLIGLGTLIDMDYDFSIKSPIVPLKGSIITGILAGILGGSMLVFGWEKWLRTKPYGVALRNIIISYTIIFFLVAIPTSAFFNMGYTGYSLLSTELWIEIYKALTGITLAVPFFFWLIIVVITMITFLVDDKYGPGVFKKFLLGKYFIPTREERVFMFLDLKSSTTIAEQLGEEKYFHFLKDVFQKITPPISQHKAEIYQYVGDEIVLSWPVIKDATKSSIACFFDIKKLLIDQSEYFMQQYDTLPQFKAGIHCGYVMAGEIGVIKREIAYSGDVLNTTARIQSKCNEHGTDLLISEDLKALLSVSNEVVRSIGKIELKGKSRELELYTVHQN